MLVSAQSEFIMLVSARSEFIMMVSARSGRASGVVACNSRPAFTASCRYAWPLPRSSSRRVEPPFVRGQSFPWHVPPPPAIAGIVRQSLAPHRIARAACASAPLVRRCRIAAARHLMMSIRKFFARARCRPVAAPASAALRAVTLAA